MCQSGGGVLNVLLHSLHRPLPANSLIHSSLLTHKRINTTMVPASITFKKATIKIGTQFLNCSCASDSAHTNRQIHGSASNDSLRHQSEGKYSVVHARRTSWCAWSAVLRVGLCSMRSSGADKHVSDFYFVQPHHDIFQRNIVRSLRFLHFQSSQPLLPLFWGDKLVLVSNISVERNVLNVVVYFACVQTVFCHKRFVV